MATISIVFRKDKTNKKGETPIHFRIVKGRRSNYISSTVKVQEKYWDEKNKRIKPGCPNAVRLNNLLYKRYQDATKQFLELETEAKYLSVRAIAKEIKGTNVPGFFELAETIMERTRADGKITTHDLRKAILGKFEGFVKKKDIALVDITASFLQKYELHLQKAHGNSPNTRHRDFKFLHQVYREGYRLGYINGHPNPFEKYKIKKEVTTRDFLSEEEIETIERLDLAENTRLEKYRNLFIFACTAYGIRVSDLILLTRDDIKVDRIVLKTQKSNHQLDVKLPTKALEIIAWFKTECNASRFVFGFLPDRFDLENEINVDLAISRETAKYNKALKEIGKKAGITKPLSSHIGRHSFATRALRKGLDIYQVSTLLTHTNIKQTQVYAKIVSDQLDKAANLF